MNAEIEALRAAMRAAQPSQRGSYIDPGRYELEVKLAKVQRTAIGSTWKETWLIEFTVILSSNPKQDVGSTITYAENPQNQGWDGRFKSALLAVIGADPSAALAPQDNETFADLMAALRYDEYRVQKGFPENFLKGRRVYCEATAGKSRKGTDITNKKWSPVPTAPAGAGSAPAAS